jgi:hypothetical protein
MNFLGNLFLHVIHGLVVRILASGAGGPGSNSGGLICGIEEEGLWKLWVVHGVTKVSGKKMNFFDMVKMSFKFIEISKSIC